MGKIKELLIDIMNGDAELGLYKDGATEIEKKKYTEKDLRDAYNYGMFAVTSGRNFNDWFKNFKKK